MKHYMVDLETMGLRPTSAILSIGMVLFNRIDVLDTFYTPVSLQSCLQFGLTTDKSTEDWWAKQSDTARKAWDQPGAPTLPEALTAMTHWMRQYGTGQNAMVYGCGSDFDNVLLANAFNAINADIPWPYYNNACYRTLRNLFPTDSVQRVGTYHNALDDAITQVLQLQRILKLHCIDLP
jgi:exodeoxyribonuclease VIII